jgi:acyl carrier protein
MPLDWSMPVDRVAALRDPTGPTVDRVRRLVALAAGTALAARYVLPRVTDPDVELIEEAVLDSLGLLELAAQLADVFRVDLDPGEIEAAGTVRAIAAAVDARREPPPDP